MAISPEKEKALAAAMGQIDRKYGKGSIMKMGEASSRLSIEVIPTGAIALDIRYELVEFLKLAVGQRIHRVDDDRARALRCTYSPFGKDRANYRNEETKRFTGAGACSNDEALALRGEDNSLLLMLVEGQRRTVGLEDFRSPRIQCTICDKRVDVQAALVARIDLNERLRPEAPLCVDRLDLFPDIIRADGRKRRGEFTVLTDDRVAQREHVHVFAAHERPLLVLMTVLIFWRLT